MPLVPPAQPRQVLFFQGQNQRHADAQGLITPPSDFQPLTKVPCTLTDLKTFLPISVLGAVCLSVPSAHTASPAADPIAIAITPATNYVAVSPIGVSDITPDIELKPLQPPVKSPEKTSNSTLPEGTSPDKTVAEDPQTSTQSNDSQSNTSQADGTQSTGTGAQTGTDQTGAHQVGSPIK